MSSVISAGSRDARDAQSRRRLVPLLTTSGVRMINLLGGSLQRAGLRLVDLEAERLIALAARRAGLTNYGPYPLGEPLEVLLRVLESEASLNLVGRLTARWEILRLLRNRLHLQRDWSSHPEIARGQIEAPIFILGLPRSGTTFLHALFAQDPALRYPAHWEVMYPSPPPEPARALDDPRIRRAGRELQWFYRLAPGFRAIHLVGPSSPQECTEITNHTFASLRFDTTYRVPSYRDWLDGVDQRPIYAFHRRMLQHLQWRCPSGRWVLKAPDHVFAMDALLATYPDARVIMTHRDPLRVAPSVASMTVALQGLFSDDVDPCEVARTVAARWADGADRLRERRMRDRYPGRFLDVQYLDLVRDPMAVMQDLYRQLELSLSPQSRGAMARFLAAHPQGKHGRHGYSLERYGLDPHEQRRRYQGYIDFFKVPAEHPQD